MSYRCCSLQSAACFGGIHIYGSSTHGEQHPLELQTKEEDCQVTQALISQMEDGQLDVHSYMRNRLFWTKSLVSPVGNKHPEETGTSGKRKEAQCNNAPYQACMCVTWLPEKGYKCQASLALFTLNKPHC